MPNKKALGSERSISALFDDLRVSFSSGLTSKLSWRSDQLRAMRQMLIEQESEFLSALWKDLHKSESEARLTELGVLHAEIKDALKNLHKWNRTKPLKVPLSFMPSKASMVPEPLGTVLIIAPWNYPLQLLLAPLVGAIAAGNTVVLKPSELAPATASVLAKFIPMYLDPRAVKVVLGAVPETTELLECPFDHIFYTGNGLVARIVLKAAAENLCPVTLELGGKSPVWIDDDKHLAAIGRRIAWMKFTNAGQTCIAPDYVMAPKSLVPAISQAIRQATLELWGKHPETNNEYGQIVNDRHWQRLTSLISCESVAWGGEVNQQNLYIGPTTLVFDDLASAASSPVMESEIFGPILPIIGVDQVADAIYFINEHDKPLALYLFSQKAKTRKSFLEDTSSGAVGINIGLLQAAASSMPFGGVGPSGMGAYHGYESWRIFSHRKPVLSKPLWPDTLRLIMPPYSGMKKEIIRKVYKAM